MARSHHSWIRLVSRHARSIMLIGKRLHWKRPTRYSREAAPRSQFPRRLRHPPPLWAGFCRVLIDEDVALTGRSTEADEKRRRGLEKGQSSPPIRRNKPTPQAKSEAVRVSVERPAPCGSPEKLLVAAPRRARRSIQKRWVLKTELKAGKKWKRRLRKGAR